MLFLDAILFYPAASYTAAVSFLTVFAMLLIVPRFRRWTIAIVGIAPIMPLILIRFTALTIIGVCDGIQALPIFKTARRHAEWITGDQPSL